MEVTAKARYIRISPYKVRLVLDLVRRMPLAEARVQLRFMNKGAAEPVLKLLNSAVANAVNNHQLSEDTLRIKHLVADGGPILYRYRPRAMGRATPLRKRTSHITVVLEGEKATPAKVVKTAKAAKAPKAATTKAKAKK